jgi:hypothetical protein
MVFYFGGNFFRKSGLILDSPIGQVAESLICLFLLELETFCFFEMELSFANGCWQVICVHALFKSTNIKDVIVFGSRDFCETIECI